MGSSPAGPPAPSAVSVRTLTPSNERSRGSSASDGESWPWPTSTAITVAAPRSSSTWLNPPVDAPASRATRPATSTREGVERARSACARRGSRSGRRRRPRCLCSSPDLLGGAQGRPAVHRHQPVGDHRRGVRARPHEPAGGERDIEAGSVTGCSSARGAVALAAEIAALQSLAQLLVELHVRLCAGRRAAGLRSRRSRGTRVVVRRLRLVGHAVHRLSATRRTPPRASSCRVAARPCRRAASPRRRAARRPSTLALLT